MKEKGGATAKWQSTPVPGSHMTQALTRSVHRWPAIKDIFPTPINVCCMTLIDAW